MAGLGDFRDFSDSNSQPATPEAPQPRSQDDGPLFDKESIYDESVAPLMHQLADICRRYRLPLVMSVCFANSEAKGVGFSTTIHGDDVTKWLPDRFKAVAAALQSEAGTVMFEPKMLVALLERFKRDPSTLDLFLAELKRRVDSR